MRERYGISGNALKIVAAISMLLDHIGLLFFPEIKLFRTLGRVALPIFSFMIAEGCRHTRNKLRYFLTVFSLAVICQTVYFLYDGDTYMSILVTFSISIALVYALQYFKESLLDNNVSITKKCLSGTLFLLAIAFAYFLNTVLVIDYGFFGCMLPVFASFLHAPKNANGKRWERLDKIPVHILSLCVGLALLALESGGHQFWSFLAVPFLLLYSGKRGRVKMKYFFYVFYPLHLLLLELINMLI